MSNGILLPDQMLIHQKLVDGPLASCIPLIANSPAGPMVTALGGMYRDEQIATMIMSGMIASREPNLTQADMIEAAFEIADEIIAYGNRRRKKTE